MLVQMALTWRLQIGIFSKMFGDIKDSHLIHGNVSSGPQRIYMGLAIGLQRPVLVKEGLYANFNIVNLREYRSGIKPRFLSKINLNPQFMQRIHLSNWNFDKVLDYIVTSYYVNIHMYLCILTYKYTSIPVQQIVTLYISKLNYRLVQLLWNDCLHKYEIY